MRYELLNEQGEPTGEVVLADEAFMAANYPDGNYRVVAEPPAPEPAPPVWQWYIDLGPFTDRLGAGSAAIDLSTEPGAVAVRSDFARRKWIDLKDPRVIAALWYLAGQPHPVLGTLTSPVLSAATVTSALSTPVVLAENLALRKLYFS